MKEITQTQVFVGLLLLSLLLRLPFFFRDVIDWDESTFILMGQSVLAGHLPYTSIWDVKPPLVFWGYGALMALLGNSILSVRVAGLLCVTITGFLTFTLYPKLGMTRYQGLGMGALTVVFLSFLWSGQATMTEHLALVPLMGAIALLSHPTSSLRFVGLAGGLMAMASLVRGNLIYPAVALGIYLCLASGRFAALRLASAYSLGLVSGIGLTWLPFAFSGQSQRWWTFVVATPLAYARSRSDELFQDLTQLPVGWLILGIGFALLLHGGVGFLFVRWWQKANSQSRWVGGMLGVTWVATELSIVRTGLGEFHYLLQLSPGLAIAGVTLGQYFKPRFAYTTYLFIALLVISLNLPIRSLLAEYQLIGDRIRTHQTLLHGPAYEISAWFQDLQPPLRSLYLMVDQVVYGLLRREPFSPLVTHPSNLTKAYLVKAMLGDNATPTGELAKILDQRPEFIVKTEALWYLPANSELGQQLAAELGANYQLVQTLQGRQIYKRVRS